MLELRRYLITTAPKPNPTFGQWVAVVLFTAFAALCLAYVATLPTMEEIAERRAEIARRQALDVHSLAAYAQWRADIAAKELETK